MGSRYGHGKRGWPSASRMGWVALWVALASALAWLGPQPALAQPSADDVEAGARFEAGRLALSAGRFEDALRDFRRAYELSGRFELLYNVGVAADRLRRNAEALAAFERFLQEAPPEHPNRAEVEERVRILRSSGPDSTQPQASAAAQRAPAADAAPATGVAPSAGERPASRDAARGGSVRPEGVALLIASGVLAVAGAVALGAGVADRASVEGAPQGSRWADVAPAAERAPVLEVSGGIGLGVGLALGALGVVLLTAPGEAPVAVGPGGRGLAVVGRW